MNNLFHINILLAVSLLTTGHIGYAHAQVQEQGDKGVDSLADYAIRLYLTQQIDDAVVEFKKILLIDPENMPAKYYLSKIADEHEKYSKVLSQVAHDENMRRFSELNVLVDKETKIYQDLVESLELQVEELLEQTSSMDEERVKIEIKEKDKLILKMQARLQKMSDLLAKKELQLEDLMAQEKNENKQIGSMNATIDEKDRKIGELIKEIEEYDNMNIEAINTLKERKSMIEELKENRSALSKELKSLKGDLNDTNLENAKLKKDLDSLDEDLRTVIFNMEVEMEGLASVIKDKDRIITEVKQQLDGGKKQEMRGKATVSSLNKEVSRLKEQIAEQTRIIDKNNEESKQNNQTVDQMKKDYELQLKSKEDALHKLGNDHSKAWEDLKIKSTQRKNNFEDKIKLLNASQLNMSSEIVRLKEENADLAKQINDLNERLKDKQQVIDYNAAQFKDFEKETDQKSNQIIETKKEAELSIKKMTSQMEIKQEEIDQLKDRLIKLGNEHEKEVDALNDQIDRERKKQRKLAEDLDEEKDRVEEISDKNEGLEDYIKRNNDELRRLENRLSYNEESSNKTIEELQLSEQKYEEIKSEFIDKDKMIGQMKNVIKEHKKVINDKSVLLNRIGKDLGRLNRELSLKRKEENERNKELSRLEKQLTQTVDELKSREYAVRDLSAQIDGLNEKIKVQQKLMDKTAKMSDSEHAFHVNKLINRIGNLKSELKLADSRFKNRDKENADLQKELSLAKGDLDGIRVQMRNQENNADLLRQDNLMMKDKIESAPTAEVGGSTEFVKMVPNLQRKMAVLLKEDLLRLNLEGGHLVFVLSGDRLFGAGSDELKADSVPILKRVASVLHNDLGGYQISIDGHSDNQPIRRSKWASNFELSVARALSVYHFFTQSIGLSEDRFFVTGKGEFHPVSDNATQSGRALNRRVEIIVYPKKVHQTINYQDFDETRFLELLGKN